MSDLKKNSKTNKIKKPLTKNYSSVRSQKGRVDTDEDWEELDPVEPEITIKKSSNGNHDDPYPVEAAIHAEHPPMDIPMQAMAHTEPPPMDIPMQAVVHVGPPSVRDIPLQSVGHKEPFIPEDLTSEAFRINSFKAESKESGKENLSESG